MAPQFTATNGPPARLLRSCTARATTSLPLPLSPTASIVTSVAATRLSWVISRCMAGAVLSQSRETCPGAARRPGARGGGAEERAEGSVAVVDTGGSVAACARHPRKVGEGGRRHRIGH
ncbi:hypothetical protein D3C72_1436240 [compost metagenome]